MSKATLILQNLPSAQQVFVREFARSAGAKADAAVAAIRAGVARRDAERQADEWLASPEVVEALCAAVRERLDVEVVTAFRALADLAKSARSETVRLAAAQAILDRSKIGPVISRSAVISANLTVEDLLLRLDDNVVDTDYDDARPMIEAKFTDVTAPPSSKPASPAATAGAGDIAARWAEAAERMAAEEAGAAYEGD